MNQKYILISCFSLFSVIYLPSISAKANHMDKHETQKGSFDLLNVEELALFYAEESIRRLKIPLIQQLGSNVSRKENIQKIRNNPPRADENLVVYPLGNKNSLSFTYNTDSKTMVVWERIMHKRGSIGYYGLTASELAAALNKSTSKKMTVVVVILATTL